jgi:AraC-like DNA-binding protein
MSKLSLVEIPAERLSRYAEELRPYSPALAERLSKARSLSEVRDIAARLFNLSLEQRVKPNVSVVASGNLREPMWQFLVENLHKGPTLKELSKLLGYSEKYCSDLFQARTGEPFSQCLKRLRLEKIHALLIESDASLSAIAEAVGFSDQFVLSHFFKKATGWSPRAYRQRHKQAQRFVARRSVRSGR